MNFVERVKEAATPIVDEVRAAIENGNALRVAGSASWLDAGRPVRAESRLSLGDRAGILDYVPGDLTITVGAGLTLRALRATIEAHDHWLPLDPFGNDDGTIGATVATASAGPLAHAFGTPRDQVIGAGVVTGRGDYIRGGGRVVKNVAGFDLTRLMIGAWGTLGAVTDVTLRLRVKPEADVTVFVAVSSDVAATLAKLSEAPIAPFAMELINARLAAQLGVPAADLLLVRLGGNAVAVKAQREALSTIGETREVDSQTWERLRSIEAADSIVVRYSGPLADVGGLWRRLATRFGDAQPLMHATVGRGVVRCIIARDAVRAVGDIPEGGAGTHRIFERLPPPMWTEVPSPVNDTLSLRVRKAFDPAMLMNPGIFGEAVA